MSPAGESAAGTTSVVVGVPCHRDEPGVARTARQLLEQLDGMDGARVVVCVNGADPESSPAAASLRTVAAQDRRLEVVLLDQASKPAAWNRLRAEPATVSVFCDADVELEPGSVRALVTALEQAPASTVLAAAAQRPREGGGFFAGVARVPFRLDWGGVAGTLYAARTEWLPEMPEGVLLDDAWLWAQAADMGEGAVLRVPAAEAVFTPAQRLGDLWRQRRRAEAGKRQLTAWGLDLAPEPAGGRPGLATLQAYPLRDWPAVAALAGIKLAAAVWSRLRPAEWGTAPSTKT